MGPRPEGMPTIPGLESGPPLCAGHARWGMMAGALAETLAQRGNGETVDSAFSGCSQNPNLSAPGAHRTPRRQEEGAS